VPSLKIVSAEPLSKNLTVRTWGFKLEIVRETLPSKICVPWYFLILLACRPKCEYGLTAVVSDPEDH